jgi:hypothetical protein
VRTNKEAVTTHTVESATKGCDDDRIMTATQGSTEQSTHCGAHRAQVGIAVLAIRGEDGVVEGGGTDDAQHRRRCGEGIARALACGVLLLARHRHQRNSGLCVLDSLTLSQDQH